MEVSPERAWLDFQCFGASAVQFLPDHLLLLQLIYVKIRCCSYVILINSDTDLVLFHNFTALKIAVLSVFVIYVLEKYHKEADGKIKNP